MNDDTKPPDNTTEEQVAEKAAVKQRILQYNADIISGKIPANKWLYAAARRWENDLERQDVYFDWDEAYEMDKFFREKLTLIGEYSNKPFILQDWQLWLYGSTMCFKWTESKTRRFKMVIAQIARGAAKSTTAAGLCLYEMSKGSGKRVHILANNQNQADIILDTAKTMVERMPANSHDFIVHYSEIISKDRDCAFDSLAALPSALDGRSPTLAIGDECSEFKSRALTKLITALGKRLESTLIITTTPGSNPENHYYELVKVGQGVLTGEVVDDTMFPILYGLDDHDSIEDESTWIKANPGLLYGQPSIQSLRRAWNTMKQSPMGRNEFTRYHCSRFSEDTGGWLPMENWESMVDPNFDWDSLIGKPAWAGLDLSRSADLSAFVLAFPLADGRVALKGTYFCPKENLSHRELEMRLPIRTWASEGKIILCPGREIDYEQIRVAINEAHKKYDLKVVGYDAWGSQLMASTLINDGVPLQTYRMAISTFGPGCDLFQNLWLGKKFIIGDDPVLRRACAEAQAKRDVHNNIRPVKAREHASIDALVASIIATHTWGGKGTPSIYELEAELMESMNGFKQSNRIN